MLGGEDWLQDPLMEISKGSSKPRKLKNSSDEKQNNSWWSFHFATRLKLDGADHFCRQVLGAASMPHHRGLPLLAHRQLEWYLSAFFFELMSAYDTLLQELNIVYAYDLGLKPKDVRWATKKDELQKAELPKELLQYMREEQKKEWFKKVRIYRNMATHHYLVPISSSEIGWGDEPLDYTSHKVYIHYRQGGHFKNEDVNVCKEYLKNMVKYIKSVWGKMAQEFQQGVLEGC